MPNLEMLESEFSARSEPEIRYLADLKNDADDGALIFKGWKKVV